MGIPFIIKYFLKDVDVKEALELQIFQFSQTLKAWIKIPYWKKSSGGATVKLPNLLECLPFSQNKPLCIFSKVFVIRCFK